MENGHFSASLLLPAASGQNSAELVGFSGLEPELQARVKYKSGQNHEQPAAGHRLWSQPWPSALGVGHPQLSGFL